MTKFVTTQSKGLITIPLEFRKKLGIEAKTLLEIKIKDDQLVLKKIDPNKNPEPEVYDEKQIQQWMKDDKLDKKTAQKLKKLFKI